VNGQDISIGHACDRPERAPTPECVPDGWTFAPSQVVLVVAIGKTNHERASGDNSPPSWVNDSMPAPSRQQTHHVSIYLSGHPSPPDLATLFTRLVGEVATRASTPRRSVPRPRGELPHVVAPRVASAAPPNEASPGYASPRAPDTCARKTRRDLRHVPEAWRALAGIADQPPSRRRFRLR
jgi:hypothetical protein